MCGHSCFPVSGETGLSSFSLLSLLSTRFDYLSIFISFKKQNKIKAKKASTTNNMDSFLYIMALPSQHATCCGILHTL